MTTYNVYRNGSKIASGLTAPAYTDTGITNGTPYSYQVSAVNGGVESPLSGAISATPGIPAIVPSANIVVNAGQNNLVIENKAFSGTIGPSASGSGVAATGTAANPIDHLTIRNCTFSGFNVAIHLKYVTNVVIQNCLIKDAWYAGIRVLSGVGAANLITGNTIQRVGPQSQAASDTCAAGSGECDAYGIDLERVANGNLVTDPICNNWLVSNNVVEDVRSWHGLHCEPATNVVWDSNIVRRCMRAMFITASNDSQYSSTPNQLSANITINNNSLQDAQSYPGGGVTGDNLAAVTLVGVRTIAITNNHFSTTYGLPAIYDFQGGSTGITESGNVSVA